VIMFPHAMSFVMPCSKCVLHTMSPLFVRLHNIICHKSHWDFWQIILTSSRLDPPYLDKDKKLFKKKVIIYRTIPYIMSILI